MVSRLEKGDYRLNGAIIISLARIFKVSADDILGLKTPAQEGTTAISRRWLKRLVKIETLPKRDQDGLIQTVDRLQRCFLPVGLLASCMGQRPAFSSALRSLADK